MDNAAAARRSRLDGPFVSPAQVNNGSCVPVPAGQGGGGNDHQ